MGEIEGLEQPESGRSAAFKIALIILLAALLVDAAVLIAVLRGIEPPTTTTAVLLTLVTFGLVALTAALRPAGPASPLPPQAGRRDREQHKRTLNLIVVSVLGLVLGTVGAMQSADFLAGDRTMPVSFVVVGAGIWGILLPMMVMGWDGQGRKARRFLDDELTRSFRARAITLGFWVLLPGVAAVYVLGLGRPDRAVAALPLVMTVAGAAACLRFALLHRAAERDE